MPAQQLLDRVRELRDAGRTPKEIARALKMPPSAVAPLIRSVAAAEGRTREDALIGCWISPGWSSSVLVFPIRHFYQRWGATIAIKRRPSVAARLHAAERALADPDADVRERAIQEAAEIVQAAYHEVAGG